jgi:hypothetical protein
MKQEMTTFETYIDENGITRQREIVWVRKDRCGFLICPHEPKCDGR